jgi:hypothetical protein
MNAQVIELFKKYETDKKNWFTLGEIGHYRSSSVKKRKKKS